MRDTVPEATAVRGHNRMHRWLFPLVAVVTFTHGEEMIQFYTDKTIYTYRTLARPESTTMSVDHHDVVIIGAGVIGCIAARELTPDYDVLVLDRTGVAAGATGLSAGLVSPTLFYGNLPDVARYANNFFREFDGTCQFSFTERDRLDFVCEDDVKEAQETVDRLSRDDFPISYLNAEEVEEDYPLLDMNGFAGAVLYADTGWVDPYSYTTALKKDAETNGASFKSGITVTGILEEDGKVIGVKTDNELYPADHVIVAAGWRTTELLSDHFSLPVRPYRTQVAVLHPNNTLPDTFPLVRIGSQDLYIRPEHNGDLLVGGSHHALDDPMSASQDADEEFQMHVADVIPDLLNGFNRVGFVNDWAGVDTGTPDTFPIIDSPEKGLDGLIVATGFNGLGITISPVAGAIIRGLVTGESLPFDLTPFQLDRIGIDNFDITYTSEM